MDNSISNITLKIIGMNCMGCVKAITTAIEKIDGVLQVNTDLTQKQVSVSFNNELVNPQSIKDAIINEGFKIEE